MAIVVLIVVLVGGYGAYRLYKHYNKPAMTPVATAPTTSASPTAAMNGNSVYKTATDPKLGTYFTDLKGMTLYTSSKDTSGVSNCSGQCIINWPAYVATTTDNLPENVTIITRTDGTKQYAYKGMPLYFWVKDVKPGDVTGEGVGGFTVAK